MSHTPFADHPSILRDKWLVTLALGLPLLIAAVLTLASFLGYNLAGNAKCDPLGGLIGTVPCLWLLWGTWGPSRRWDVRAAWVLENVQPKSGFALIKTLTSNRRVSFLIHLYESLDDKAPCLKVLEARAVAWEPSKERRPVTFYEDPQNSKLVVLEVDGFRLWPYPDGGWRV